MQMQILTGHRSFETAYKIENYPWGFKLRTTQYVWIETVKKKGDRVVRQTIDPRTGKLCAPKCSTFSPLKWLYLDEVGHVQSDDLSPYESDKEKIREIVALIGMENLVAEQVDQYNALLGIHKVERDEFTGAPKKDFSVKWEKDAAGKCDEVRITFDRPDGVKLIEILRAMKSLNQERLREVFEVRHSPSFGDYPGTVRICTRGGMQLVTVPEDTYREWLASDTNAIMEDVQGEIKFNDR